LIEFARANQGEQGADAIDALAREKVAKGRDTGKGCQTTAENAREKTASDARESLPQTPQPSRTEKSDHF
jgi:hypothetical protein